MVHLLAVPLLHHCQLKMTPKLRIEFFYFSSAQKTLHLLEIA